MKRDRLFFSITFTCLTLLGQAVAQHKPHLTITPNQINWGPMSKDAMRGTPPAGFSAPRAEVAAIEGDPSKPGPFVIRIKAPDGEKVAPHWHPTDEHLTILQGTFILGKNSPFEGDRADHRMLRQRTQAEVALRTAERRDDPGQRHGPVRDELRGLVDDTLFAANSESDTPKSLMPTFSLGMAITATDSAARA